jgi:hypothetical protein
MFSRWSNILIVLVWLSTTTWLIVAKVVPPLRRGEPPSYQSMYGGTSEDDEPPVAWQMTLREKPLGWAVCKVNKKKGDLTKVHTRVHFDRIPLEELLPPWLKTLVNTTLEPTEYAQMDALSDLYIDTLGRLASFNSRLRVPGFQSAVRIAGRIHGSMLNVKVETIDSAYLWETYLPSDALINDELSPLSRLSGLHVGQEWTVPVFSPLRPQTLTKQDSAPIEVLQARVESKVLLPWENQARPVMLVVYRPDSGSALSSTREPRVKLWVQDDGTVLKQEVSILGSPLEFVRLSPARSAELESDSSAEEQTWQGQRSQNRQREANLPPYPNIVPHEDSN